MALKHSRLSSQAELSPRDEERLDEILGAFLEAADAGRAPDRADLLRQHPEFARQLREFFADQDRVDRVTGASDPTNSILDRTLGEYRLLREIGHGGMGVVYEAEQASLGRRVALKILPFAAALDQRQLQRFKNEALAAGQLHHQNIVPVYSVGCEAGVHYFAMQFIDGPTLAAVIEQLRELSGTGGRGPASADGLSRLWNELESLASGNRQAVSLGSAPDELENESGDESPQSKGETPRDQAALSTERSVRSPSFIRTVARLGLQAAEGLEHAHSVDIVHRDIKPSNLMVDGRGNLWIADFGLARVQNDLGLTATGDVMGTIRYMSPEQALGRRGLVDHRCDIYSLGATLYELLTLRPVFDAETREEMMRRISQDEPRPARQLNPAIPVELETIVLKSLGKSPDSRYATAQALADDLRRFLDDKPILAKPPTALERLRKFVRRHRAIVSTAAIASAVLVIAGVAMFGVSYARISAALAARDSALADLRGEKQKADTALIAESNERIRANKQAAIAKAVSDFLREDVLAVAALGNQRDPAEQPDPNLTVRDALARAAKRIGTRFADEPLVEAAIRSTIGDSYRQLGEFSAAQPHLERALELYRKVLGPEATETLLAINRLASWHDNQGQPEAIGLWLSVVEVGRRVHGPDHEATLMALNNLGVAHQKQGRLREAADSFQPALDGFRRTRGPLHPDTLTLTMNVANLLETNGDFARAVALLKEVVAARVAQQGLENQDTLIARSNLALVQWRAGQFDEAERTLSEVLDSHRRLTGPAGALTLISMNRLANFYLERSRFDEAEKLIRESLETLQRTQGSQSSVALGALHDLGLLLYNQNRLNEAEAAWREALAGFRRNLEPDNPTTLASLNNLGVLHRDLHRYDESEAELRELLAARRRTSGDEHVHVAQALGELAETLIRQQRFADAEPLLREALAIDEARQPDDWSQSLDQMRLGASLLGQNKYSDAEPLLLATHQGLTERRAQLPPWGAKYLVETVRHLVALYDAWEKPDEAARWRKELPPAK